MKIQFANKLSNIEYKSTDVLFCYLDEKININDEIQTSTLLNYFKTVSITMNCLIFLHFINIYNNPNFQKHSVAIISNGEIIEIRDENDIEINASANLINTRLGKTALLIETDIYNDNIEIYFKELGATSLVIFTNSLYKQDALKLGAYLNYFIVTEKEILTNTNNICKTTPFII